ncbi:MAG: RNA-protein complex protein Nop10 [Thermoproteus sp.]
MKSLLRRCARCGAYTLKKDVCPKCGGPLEVPHPAKYSPEDRYQLYRVKMKVMAGRLPVKEETRAKILGA